MEDNIEYPPRPKADVKFASKHSCGICARPLPFSPFSGIGWRDVSLDGTKRRQRICNECYVEWRKKNPPKPHEVNLKFWNRLISFGWIALALFGLWSFSQTGVAHWMQFLSGAGLWLIVIGVFLYIFSGLINKRIEFVPPKKPSGEKKKFTFRPPDNVWGTQESPFKPRPKETGIPKSLYISQCEICGLEKGEDELFTHPDGFKICNDCIARKKHYETNHN